jgi:hypothetical protein
VNGREPGYDIDAVFQLGVDLYKRDVVIGLDLTSQRSAYGSCKSGLRPPHGAGSRLAVVSTRFIRLITEDGLTA